jgi:hypothetical protein
MRQALATSSKLDANAAIFAAGWPLYVGLVRHAPSTPSGHLNYARPRAASLWRQIRHLLRKTWPALVRATNSTPARRHIDNRQGPVDRAEKVMIAGSGVCSTSTRLTHPTITN